jgi:hypothetical protein
MQLQLCKLHVVDLCFVMKKKLRKLTHQEKKPSPHVSGVVGATTSDGQAQPATTSAAVTLHGKERFF